MAELAAPEIPRPPAPTTPPSQLGAEIPEGNNARATTSEVVNPANWNGKESSSGTIRALSDFDVVDRIVFGHQSTSQRHRPLQITYKTEGHIGIDHDAVP